jgi:hypothetical protein
MTEVEQDFLEVDRPIPGQNFVCLSFISPENVLEDKNLYSLYKFHLSQNEGSELTFSQFKEQYTDFSDSNEKTLQQEFDEICDFKTNVRGIKIRGVYDTQREANIRAQVLQKMDSSFHVYVGQVGYWLPWDPNPNNIEEQEYLNKDLNRLNKEYTKNQTKKDMFYEEQKREKKMAALRENEAKKQIIEQEKQATLEAETLVHDGETVGTTDGDKTLEEALNDVDPWMQRKLEQDLTGGGVESDLSANPSE